MGMSEQEVYQQYFERVYKTVFYILKNEEMAKDATQETFIKAFKKLYQIRDCSKLEAWITTIATRTAIDIYNKNKKTKTIEYIDDEYGVFINNQGIEKVDLETYLNQLNPEHQQILVLKYLEDLSEKEIAKFLKVKLGTVKSRLSRAKKRLLDQYQSRGVSNG